MEKKNIIVDSPTKRLDSYIAEKLNISRSQVKHLFEKDLISIEGKKVKPSHTTKIGEKVKVIISPPPPLKAEPEKIPLDIIYEDDDLLVINKPAKMVVHPSPGHYKGTLVNAVLNYTKKLSETGDELRPGIIHRLDMDTSGIIIVVKTNDAHVKLAEEWQEKKVKKEYIALVYNKVKEKKGVISTKISRSPRERKKFTVITDSEIKSREAVTEYEVMKTYENHTLLKIKPITGRTHQIRVHMAYIKHPVVGDTIYAKRKSKKDIDEGRLMLHASKISFIHPSKKKKVNFEASIPDDFKKVLKKIDIST